MIKTKTSLLYSLSEYGKSNGKNEIGNFKNENQGKGLQNCLLIFLRQKLFVHSKAYYQEFTFDINMHKIMKIQKCILKTFGISRNNS